MNEKAPVLLGCAPAALLEVSVGILTIGRGKVYFQQVQQNTTQSKGSTREEISANSAMLKFVWNSKLKTNNVTTDQCLQSLSEFYKIL